MILRATQRLQLLLHVLAHEHGVLHQRPGRLCPRHTPAQMCVSLYPTLLVLLLPLSVSLHPLGSAPALLNFGALAELYVFLGDHGRARAVLSAGLASRRPTARFLRTAALLERRLGDAAAAAQLLARAVARAPRDYRSWLAVGICY
jgi:hypothetical protein